MGLPKGRTNNPNGRPKVGHAFADMVKERMKAIDEVSKKAYKEILVNILFEHALGRADKSNPQLTAHAWKLLIEYDSGKPIQPIGGIDGGPMELKVVIEDSMSDSEDKVSQEPTESVSIAGAV